MARKGGDSRSDDPLRPPAADAAGRGCAGAVLSFLLLLPALPLAALAPMALAGGGSPMDDVSAYLLFFSPLLLLVAGIAAVFAYRHHSHRGLALALVSFVPVVLALWRLAQA